MRPATTASCRKQMRRASNDDLSLETEVGHTKRGRQFDNPNRPTRIYSRNNHLVRCTWRIPAAASTPRTSPAALSDEIARCILAIRAKLQRCAEVVWHHLVTVLGVIVSLSSVRRTLKRNHCFDGSRKKRVRPDNPERP